MVSAEALATVNVRVLRKLYVNKNKGKCWHKYEKKLSQSPRFGSGPFDLLIRKNVFILKAFCFQCSQ